MTESKGVEIPNDSETLELVQTPVFPFTLKCPRDFSKTSDRNVDNVLGQADRIMQLCVNSNVLPEHVIEVVQSHVKAGRIAFLYIYVPSYNSVGRPEYFGYALMVYATTAGTIKYTIISNFVGDEAVALEADHGHNNFNELRRYWNDVYDLFVAAIV